MKKTLEQYADQATREIGRWYGQRQFFAAPKTPEQSCRDFLLAHWRKFPAVDPTGGQIIDGSAVEIVEFLEIEVETEDAQTRKQ